MRSHSICVLSVLGLLGLAIATPASRAQGLTPGQAAPPLQTLDLTKPGPRPSAVTQQAARPAPAAPAAAVSAARPVAKEPPATAKAAPAKVKPGTLVASGPARKSAKVLSKSAKGKPVAKPTIQTSTAGDR